MAAAALRPSSAAEKDPRRAAQRAALLPGDEFPGTADWGRAGSERSRGRLVKPLPL